MLGGYSREKYRRRASMNAYTTRGEARIKQRDIDAVLYTDAHLAGVSLAALERQRGWQAEAEVERLIKQYGVTSSASTSLISLVRQTIGAALVCVGERLAGYPRSDTSVESSPATGTLGTAS
jgi:hypothetical protein